jgi:hypothetical protein
MMVLHNREMKAVGFSEELPVFVASAIFSITQPSPGNLEKIITYSSDLMGASGPKVRTIDAREDMLVVVEK